jgi:hypothetical protein
VGLGLTSDSLGAGSVAVGLEVGLLVAVSVGVGDAVVAVGVEVGVGDVWLGVGASLVAG